MHHTPPKSTLFPYTTLFRSSTLNRNAEVGTLNAELKSSCLQVQRSAFIVSSNWSRAETRQSNFQTVSLMTSTNRSEEHTSELQSRFDLVCRLLLEKKKYNFL